MIRRKMSCTWCRFDSTLSLHQTSEPLLIVSAKHIGRRVLMHLYIRACVHAHTHTAFRLHCHGNETTAQSRENGQVALSNKAGPVIGVRMQATLAGIGSLRGPPHKLGEKRERWFTWAFYVRFLALGPGLLCSPTDRAKDSDLCYRMCSEYAITFQLINEDRNYGFSFQKTLRILRFLGKRELIDPQKDLKSKPKIQLLCSL